MSCCGAIVLTAFLFLPQRQFLLNAMSPKIIKVISLKAGFSATTSTAAKGDGIPAAPTRYFESGEQRCHSGIAKFVDDAAFSRKTGSFSAASLVHQATASTTVTTSNDADLNDLANAMAEFHPCKLLSFLLVGSFFKY